MKKIRQKLYLFFRKHYKIYTLLVLILGIAIGCTYEGVDEGTHYFNILGHTVYLGFVL